MVRTDVHAPGVIIPEDYEYVAQECIKIEGIGEAEFIMREREKLRKHMEKTGGTYSGHQHGGNCMVCGSVNAIYTILFYHAKTNSYVRMGQDCATKCECGDPALFKAFRGDVQNAREALKGATKAKLLLEDAGMSECWDIFKKFRHFKPVDFPGREEATVVDMVEKLVKWGSLSEKQMEYLKKLPEFIRTRAAREAQRAAEKAAAKDCPEGRMDVVGVVLTKKYQESQFGDVLKMLVKHADGWCVWGTVPGNLQLWQEGDAQYVLEPGDKVEFTATLQRSDKDAKFGFFKRPTNAKVLEMKQR